MYSKNKENFSRPLAGILPGLARLFLGGIATSPSVPPMSRVIGSMSFSIASLINLASFLMRLKRFRHQISLRCLPKSNKRICSYKQKEIVKGISNKGILKRLRPLPWFLDFPALASIRLTVIRSKPASTAALRLLTFLLIKLIWSQIDLYLAPLL
jgi:hypothetical protein